MRNRKYHFLYVMLFLIIATAFYSCIDEPKMTVPIQPIATIRLGNFSSTVPSMKILVDGVVPTPELNSLGYTQISSYFTTIAGDRKIAVLIPSTGGKFDTIFSKILNFGSYNITNLFFKGEYTADSTNTFNRCIFDEGSTFVSHTPDAGTINLYFVNLLGKPSNPSDKVGPDTVDVRDRTNKLDSLLAVDILPDDSRGFGNARAGGRKFTITVASKTTVLLSDSTNYIAGKNYYFFLSGRVSKDTIVVRSSDAVPQQSRLNK